jgi:O-antigen ligase
MSAWLNPLSLSALAVTLVVLAIALQRPVRGIQLYAVLGAAPLLQLGAFSGRTISQGLMMAESLATVLFVVWFVRRSSRRRARAPFELPWLLFALVALTSQFAVMLLPDHRVEPSAWAVAAAQLLLVLWPIGVYLATAEFVTSTEHLQWLQRAVIGLATAQLVAPWLPPPWRPYVGWVWTFGIFASPFAFAATFATRRVPVRLFLVGVAVLPFVRGVQDGKAFLYLYVAAGVGTILWLRSSRLVAVAGATLAAVVLAAVVVVGDDVTRPVRALVAQEQRQMSYGGRSGRGQLALDALSIWQEAPLLGVGPANSYIYMLQRSPIGTPHNQYLNILVEFGVLGLAAWLAFLAFALRTGLRIYRRTVHPAHRTFVLGWLGMFAGMVVGGVTGDFMVHSVRNGGIELFSGYYLQWIMLGGLVAVDRLERAARRRREARQTAEEALVATTAPLLMALSR